MQIVKPDAVTTTGSVTRTGTATYYDSNGYLKTSTPGALRFGYNPSTLEFVGLIIEDTRTNLVANSSAIDSSYWGKSITNISPNSEKGPDDSYSGDGLIPTSSNGLHGVYRTISGFSASETTTASVYVKTNISKYVRLYVYGNGDAGHLVRFNFVEESITIGNTDDFITNKGNTIDYGFEKLKNGWYRIWLTGYPDNYSTNRILRIHFSDEDGNFSFSGDAVTSYAYCYGVQLEIGSKPTSYILTGASTVTRAAEVITGSGLLYTNVTNPYSEWSSATTYSLGQIVVVGTYTGSNIVDITNSGTYKSLTNSNLNNNPVTSPTSWVRTGPTNQFAVFDNVISSSTVKDSDIIFVVKSTSVDSVAVLNSTSDKINCAVSDASYSETFLYNIAYSRTTQLNGSESIDWFSYFFFDEYVQKTQAIYLDIPQVSNGIVSIKISGTVNVTAGSFVEGQMKALGATQYGASAGITDYSKKEVDEFGNTVLVVRNYSKRMQAKIFLSNSNLNTVQRILYSIRATPVLWIASDDSQLEEPLIVMGYYKDFDTEIAYPAHSLCNLTIEGLI